MCARVGTPPYIHTYIDLIKFCHKTRLATDELKVNNSRLAINKRNSEQQ